MQMDEKKPSVPKLRFPGFTDPWEQRKLGDLIEINSGRDYKHLENGGIPVYGTGGLLAYVNEALSYKKDAVGIGRKGTIDHPYKLKAPFWTVDTLFYAVPSSQTDLDFVLGLFHRINWKSKDESTGLPSLSKKIINNVPIMAPLFQEQQKIGKALSYCDSLITLHQRKLEHLREMKRGLLQKMFPRDGESAPELRFPGFTDPWEQRKLGDLASFTKGSGYSKSDIKSHGKPLILYGSLYTDYKLAIDAVNTFADEQIGSTFSRGGEVVVPSSGETSEDIAVASAVMLPGVMIGSGLNVIVPGKELDPVFLAISITGGRQHRDLARKAQGKSVVHLYNDDIAASSIDLPALSEQLKIRTLFLRIDSLITLHQRKLEHLQEMKKGLLQQMFV